MTQLEFDAKMREIRAERDEAYKVVDALIVENKRQADMVGAQIHSKKEELAALITHRKELEARRKDIARVYHEKQTEFIQANPKAQGTPSSNGGGITMKEAHALRRSLLEQLKERFADVDGIDTDCISVQFRIEGETLQFETNIPKKREDEGEKRPNFVCGQCRYFCESPNGTTGCCTNAYSFYARQSVSKLQEACSVKCEK